ncbi:hypothetical protein GYMLUDRAFT_88644 [Collybiopsis luxurians FD-317 M1]|uniref:Uncharacterized protein n=1 Tax=Collybiopsis luxurians FD-317 M1 TaxID=944289 RepID=A0A0D0BST1_9AGAR|nr:hypothetical protein GYMLUDRAFT_88644 [Collybiopsis luxurians FD-317 M1]
MSSQLQSSQSQPLALSSIAEWTDERVAEIYLARSTAKAKQAIEDLFSPHVKASLNGRSITRAQIDQLLLGMRSTEEGDLGFYWTDLVDVSGDPKTHRNGALGGVYIITGLQLPHPETGKLVPSFRRKCVAIKVESQSEDLSIDSRKITEFTTIAYNYPMDQLEALEKKRAGLVDQHKVTPRL